MTMYPGVSYGPGIGGLNNGGYWTALAQTSGGAINAAGATYLGTIATSQTASAAATYTLSGPSYDDTTRIRTGEITGIRVWELQRGLLHSVYMGHVWHPGEVMYADKVLPHWGPGIHAFKTIERAKREYHYGDYIFGEVALWGEVIEFECGWKAEFAKVTKIYTNGFLFGRLGAWRLRKRYGV